MPRNPIFWIEVVGGTLDPKNWTKDWRRVGRAGGLPGNPVMSRAHWDERMPRAARADRGSLAYFEAVLAKLRKQPLRRLTIGGYTLFFNTRRCFPSARASGLALRRFGGFSFDRDRRHTNSWIVLIEA